MVDRKRAKGDVKEVEAVEAPTQAKGADVIDLTDLLKRSLQGRSAAPARAAAKRRLAGNPPAPLASARPEARGSSSSASSGRAPPGHGRSEPLAGNTDCYPEASCLKEPPCPLRPRLRRPRTADDARRLHAARFFPRALERRVPAPAAPDVPPGSSSSRDLCRGTDRRRRAATPGAFAGVRWRARIAPARRRPDAGWDAPQRARWQGLISNLLLEEVEGDWVAWLCTASALPLIDGLHPRLVVYDCMEASSQQEFVAQAMERQLLDVADLVLAAGPALWQSHRIVHRERTLRAQFGGHRPVCSRTGDGAIPRLPCGRTAAGTHPGATARACGHDRRAGGPRPHRRHLAGASGLAPRARRAARTGLERPAAPRQHPLPGRPAGARAGRPSWRPGTCA